MMECTKPGLFAAGPDWLEPGEQRRQEALWQIARGRAAGEGSELRLHVKECRACARMVESFARLDRASRAESHLFAACPSAKELSDYHYFELAVEQREKVAKHLKDCPDCREELGWLARTKEPDRVVILRRRWMIGLAAAAAAAVLFLVPIRWHSGARRYADLARMPAIDRKDLIATLDQPDKFRPALEDSLNAYDSGDYRAAETKIQPILDAFPSDPSGLYVKAMAEYRKGNLDAAGGLMAQSERTQPMSAFRCWSALQMGLATGNRERIDRECKHLGNHPEYEERVRQIREAVTRRGA
jgi:uncharacterized protein (DUF1778 family)